MTQKALVRSCKTWSNKPVISNGPSVDGPGNLAGERQGALNRNEGCSSMSAGKSANEVSPRNTPLALMVERCFVSGLLVRLRKTSAYERRQTGGAG